MEWQSIETAPKGDADRVLLRFGDEAVSVAYWDLYYAEGGNGCTNGFAWVEPCSGDPLDLHYSTAPDGWMPLP